MSSRRCCPAGPPSVARSDSVIALTSVAIAETWVVTSSIDAGCVPRSVTVSSGDDLGAFCVPGSSSMYFSPRSPRFATCAEALLCSGTSLSISRVTSAFPLSRRRTVVTFPLRTPATRTADFTSRPATLSNSTFTCRVPLPRLRSMSSIFRTKYPRIARMISMKTPTFAADDIVGPSTGRYPLSASSETTSPTASPRRSCTSRGSSR